MNPSSWKGTKEMTYPSGGDGASSPLGMIHSIAVVLAWRRPFLSRPSTHVWRTSERSHSSIEEWGWRCRRSDGGVGLERESFADGGAETRERRPKLESERQRDWRGKDAAAHTEVGEKLLHL